MKRFFGVIMAFLVMTVFAPIALAEGFYIGVGVATIKEEMPVTKDDSYVMSVSDVPIARTEDSSHSFKQLILGLVVAERFALEIGFAGGDSGTTATTRGEYTFVPGNDIKVTSIQSNKVSTTSLSAIGNLPLGETFGIFARAGALHMKKLSITKREVRNSATGALLVFPFEEIEKETKTSGIFGLGLTAKLSKNLTLRMEAQKTSALQGTLASAALVYGF